MYEFISEKEIEKIVLEHVVNAKKVEDRSKELLKHAFEQITSRILLQVKLHIENSNSFKSVEKVYIETNNFKKRYLEYLEFDYNKDIITDNEIEILNGVFKSISDATQDFPEYTENPLEYERMLIISTGLLRIKEAMNTIQDEIVASFELPSSLNVSFSDVLFHHMHDRYVILFDSLNEIVESIV